MSIYAHHEAGHAVVNYRAAGTNEIRPRKDRRSVDVISDVLPFGRLWYGEPNAVSNAIGYAKFFSRSHDAVIRVYDEAGSVIKAHSTRASSKSVFRLAAIHDSATLTAGYNRNYP